MFFVLFRSGDTVLHDGRLGRSTLQSENDIWLFADLYIMINEPPSPACLGSAEADRAFSFELCHR